MSGGAPNDQAKTDERRKTARRSEIDRDYKRKRREPDGSPRRVSISALRASQLNRFLLDRYGQVLPDDDAGRDDARLMAHHLAHRINPSARIASWLSLRAPWMDDAEAQELITTVLAKPLRWRADTLAARLGLTEADRRRLRITTIGAIDMDKDQRKAARRERSRLARQADRRAAGVKPRNVYLAEQRAKRDKPRQWTLLGMSRAAWYRAGKPAAQAA